MPWESDPDAWKGEVEEGPLDLWVLGADGRTPVLARSVHELTACLANPGRRVAQTDVGGAWLSTVFVGIGCLFETMLFNPDVGGGSSWRHDTWDEAEAFHRDLAARLLAQLPR